MSFGGKHFIRLVGSGALGIPCLLTANALIYTFTIPCRATPVRSEFVLTTAATVGPSTITFTHASTGDCGVFTIPLTAAIKEIYYEHTDYVSGDTGVWKGSLDEGDQVTCTISATTDASGAGHPILVLEENAEAVAGNSSFIEI
jgi:hypothetical protein